MGLIYIYISHTYVWVGYNMHLLLPAPALTYMCGDGANAQGPRRGGRGGDMIHPSIHRLSLAMCFCLFFFFFFFANKKKPQPTQHAAETRTDALMIHDQRTEDALHQAHPTRAHVE